MITASTDAEINFTFQKLFYSMNLIADYYLLLQLPWRTIRLLLLNHAAVSHFLQPLGLQNICLPCPSLSPKVCSNPCPVSRWCLPTITFSVTPYSSCFSLLHHQGLFQKSQHLPSGSQITGDSASALVLAINIQGWFPLGLTGLIALQFKEISGVFSSTTLQKHQFFGAKIFFFFFLWWQSHICTWRLEK